MLIVNYTSEVWVREFETRFPKAAETESLAMLATLTETWRGDVLREFVHLRYDYNITHKQSKGVGVIVQRGNDAERAAFDTAMEKATARWYDNEWA
jgi:hypothetical protein